MKDGIYRVELKNGAGVAMLRNGVFKGIDQSHTYLGEITERAGRITGRLSSKRYVMQNGASTIGESVVIDGREEEGAFEADARDESESTSHFRISGTWVAEL